MQDSATTQPTALCLSQSIAVKRTRESTRQKHALHPQKIAQYHPHANGQYKARTGPFMWIQHTSEGKGQKEGMTDRHNLCQNKVQPVRMQGGRYPKTQNRHHTCTPLKHAPVVNGSTLKL
jgi:hypothetical protein